MITNISSNINAGGDLATISGVNTNIVGSNITSLGNAAITTGADLNILSAQDTSYKYSASWKKGSSTFGANSKSSSSENATTTNIASNINVGGDLNIGSQDNINIAASNLNSDQNINLIAKNEVNIESGQNTSESHSETSKKGSSVRKSAKDIDVKVGNVASNLSTNGDINIASGADTNIIASNLSGTNGNIIVGKYTDQNASSPTFGQEIINNDAKLTIKSGEDYHYKLHQETKLEKDKGAMLVGAVAAGTVAFFTAGAGAVAMAAAGGAMTGSQGQRGRTITNTQETTTQVSSNLNFTGDLNTQSSGDTVIKASNITADNATILTGKFRDQSTNQETIINPDAQLKLNSAFNTQENHTTVRKVVPNYVGIAAVSAGATYAGAKAEAALEGSSFAKSLGSLPENIPFIGGDILPQLGNFATSKIISSSAGQIDPLFNIRNKSSSSSYKQTETNTNLHFNNLITE